MKSKAILGIMILSLIITGCESHEIVRDTHNNVENVKVKENVSIEKEKVNELGLTNQETANAINEMTNFLSLLPNTVGDIPEEGDLVYNSPFQGDVSAIESNEILSEMYSFIESLPNTINDVPKNSELQYNSPFNVDATEALKNPLLSDIYKFVESLPNEVGNIPESENLKYQTPFGDMSVEELYNLAISTNNASDTIIPEEKIVAYDEVLQMFLTYENYPEKIELEQSGFKPKSLPDFNDIEFNLDMVFITDNGDIYEITDINDSKIELSKIKQPSQ